MLKTRTAVAKTESAAPRPVLILDDNPGRWRSARSALCGAGYSVEIASEAQDAGARCEASRPGLMVVDFQIPGPGGRPLARLLLTDRGLQPVPVLAVMADASAAEQHRQAGDLFDGYVWDPVDPARLLPEFQVLFAKAAPAQHQSAQAGAAANPAIGRDLRSQAEAILESIEAGLPESQSAPPTLASLDQLVRAAAAQAPRLAEYLARARRLTEAHTVRGLSGFGSLIRLCRELAGRDPDPAPGLEQLRSEYLDNRMLELSALTDALRSSDFAALATTGHNLKGTGAAYGFAELTELGKALEIAAKANDSFSVELRLAKIECYLSLLSGSPAP